MGRGNVGLASLSGQGGTVSATPSNHDMYVLIFSHLSIVFICDNHYHVYSSSEHDDDDDFDQFLESVKVKQLSVTKKSKFSNRVC